MLLPLPKVGGGGSWVDGPSRGGRQPHGISPPRGGVCWYCPVRETPELVPTTWDVLGGLLMLGSLLVQGGTLLHCETTYRHSYIGQWTISDCDVGNLRQDSFKNNVVTHLEVQLELQGTYHLPSATSSTCTPEHST